jgi:hypothetical protein
MVWIASQTVGAGGSGVAFSSIPQTFTHLQIRITGRSNSSGLPTMYTGFNGDIFAGSTNNASHTLVGDGATVSSVATSLQPQMNLFIGNFIPNTTTSTIQASILLDVLDYSNTNKNKTIRALMGWDANGSGKVTFNSGLWTNIAAITRIDLVPDGNFIQGTRADLYGITSSQVTGAL